MPPPMTLMCVITLYQNIQYILKKSIDRIPYILKYLIKIKFDIFDINVIGLNS